MRASAKIYHSNAMIYPIIYYLASGHAFVLKGKKNLVSVWKEEEKNRLQKSAARLQILTGQTDPF